MRLSRPLKRCRLVLARQKAFVETIELDFDALRLKARVKCSNNPQNFCSNNRSAEDALRMEEVVGLFSTAFEQIT